VTPKALQSIRKSYEEKRSFFDLDTYIGFFESSLNDDFIFLYIEGIESLNETSRNLLEIFSNNIAVAFNNISLNYEIIDTQKELLERLGEMVELRSNETSNHVKRVAAYSYILALAYGMNKEDAFIFKLASPMHDVGKLAIPDDILKKPSKLTPKEFETMKTHTTLGFNIFKGTKKKILKIAAIIALQHHEKWDGTGYPKGLKGEEIDIYARITAVADVFDSLTQERVYKKAWEIDRVIEFLKEQSGKAFDPKLIELFLQNLDKILEVKSELES
jgi:response regulator RpfG family c-di-GMP phosphodiesterase